jgi:hypothetical protein
MPHALTLVHSGGHLYGPGGVGSVEFDPAQLLTAEIIAETRDLPGFVDTGRTVSVTYESHHFWIHFLRYARNPDAERFCAVLIRVHDGAGWEVWRGDPMLAAALSGYGGDARGLFLLCWFLRDSTRAARDAGRHETAAEYRRAFVDGRLRKRKLPAQGKVKVWIEPEAAQPLAAVG